MWLGLDSSTHILSLCFSNGGERFETTHLETERRLGEELFIHLQKVMTAQEITPAQLTGIAVGLGPGTFTGTRVGIAAALAMAQGLGIPVAGISSFEALARAVDASRILVISDARSNQFYYAFYERQRKDLHPVLPLGLGTLEEICHLLPHKNIWLVGPEGEKIKFQIQTLDFSLAEKMQAVTKTPNAEDILRATAPSLRQGGMDWAALEPFYIRRTQAEEQRQNA